MQPSNLFEDPAPERWDKPEPEPEWKGQAVVWGPAQTQGSKKGFIHPKLKRVVIVDDNDRALKGWRSEWIGEMAKCRPARPIDSAVAVEILVYVRRPSAHYGSGKNAGILKANAPVIPPSGKDNDKICRAILDAGQIAGWYTNDARVADLQIKRRYDEGIERVLVWCWTMHSIGQERPDFGEAPAEPEVEPYEDAAMYKSTAKNQRKFQRKEATAADAKHVEGRTHPVHIACWQCGAVRPLRKMGIGVIVERCRGCEDGAYPYDVE